MAGEPDVATSQAMDELKRQLAALTLENARLSDELGRRTDDLQQSLEYQTAIGEVLNAISRSTFDLAPVLQTLTETALRLCEAEMGFICRRDGETFLVVTAAGTTPEIASDADDYRRYQAARPIAIDRGSLTGRVALAGQPVQIPDIAADPEYRLAGATQLGKIRTQLGVPLVREGRLVGVLVLSRQRVEPFSERQIGLLRTFADQAVIAMENARLLGELRESLARQTATSEILQVINASPRDLAPVFEAMLERAVQLSDSAFGMMNVWEDGHYRTVALRGVPQGLMERWVSAPTPGPLNALSRIAGGEDMVHIEDLAAYESYRLGDERSRALVETGGARSLLAVALRKEGVLLGVLTAYRQEVRPFTDKQIALLQGFAAQAVIAMENARLLEELRDRQAELRVTLDNTGDGVVMFDADLRLASWNRNFQEMLDVPDAFVARRPRFDDYVGLLAGRGELGDGDPASIVASYHERAARQWSAERTRPDGRIVEVRNNPVPDGGAVLIYSDITERKQAEAAIAAARDAAEEALEQQTATAEILRAISESPTNVQPVLDAVVKAAVRFCGATDAVIILREGEAAFFAAHEGPMTTVLGSRLPLDRETSPGRAILDGRTCHLPDIAALDPIEFAGAHRIAAAHGFRAALAAPLLRQGAAIGSVTLRKAEAGPFAPRQIELLETFAAQAVIAIENVRLFNDLSESLEQQTATSEILRVIASSPNDVQPVFDVVVKSAVRLCGAQDSLVVMRHGSEVVFEAHEGPLGGDRGDRWPLVGENVMGRAIIEGRTVHVADASALAPGEFDRTKDGVALYGFKAIVAAPLIRKGSAIGALLLRRQEAGPYTPRQIELLETFADQAVIAIENVRLFTELSESLERQTATADILKVIASSPADMKPAFDAIAGSARRLLGGLSTTVWRLEGDAYHLAAFTPTTEEADRALREMTVLPKEQGDTLAPAAAGRVVTEIADTESGPLFMREIARLRGFRACLAVSLAIEGQSIGFVNVTRREPGIFRPEDVELLKTFADQAVIAIQNARLFSELSDALEQQTATGEILKVIASSPTDVQPVLDAVARAALRFCGAPDAVVWLRDGDDNVVAAHEGMLTASLGLRRPIATATFSGQAMLEGRTRQIADVDALDATVHAGVLDLARQHKWRASAAAPMMHRGKAIGCVVLRKPEPGLLSPQQIELLETFAAQAVIAIENVRLFTELRDSLERLKAAQANLIQSEKMASLGQLTAGIAHEIKNPLNFVNNFAALSVELLGELKETADAAFATLDADTQAEVDETMELLVGNLGKIAEHGKRADGIVKSMLSHSRGGSGDWAPSDINALVEEALNLAYHGARAQDNEFNVTLERDFEKTSKPIELVPQDVTRVFLNLFGNGFYALGKQRTAAKQVGYRPTLRVSTRDLGEAVEVRVRDNGTGIPPDVREKMFQPFFTTKPTGEGTGLGLSISYDIVTQQHGGTIEVESEPGSFTEFTVRLPRRRVQASERAR
ncbi:MAG: GAF domain-containing protein [Reyranellaceae bacterium]